MLKLAEDCYITAHKKDSGYSNSTLNKNQQEFDFDKIEDEYGVIITDETLKNKEELKQSIEILEGIIDFNSKTVDENVDFVEKLKEIYNNL